MAAGEASLPTDLADTWQTLPPHIQAAIMTLGGVTEAAASRVEQGSFRAWEGRALRVIYGKQETLCPSLADASRSA